MRFSSVTVLSVVAVLASSISATPIDAATDNCPWICQYNSECWECCTTGLVYLRSESYVYFHIDAVWDAQIASDRSC
ncbi:hypothetical protein C8R48DRAFT_687046 [Suillus tomentosus]|nr:hypothetical protein C8R48DRAFT_687046 [Suillus tomentosus]